MDRLLLGGLLRLLLLLNRSRGTEGRGGGCTKEMRIWGYVYAALGGERGGIHIGGERGGIKWSESAER